MRLSDTRYCSSKERRDRKRADATDGSDGNHCCSVCNKTHTFTTKDGKEISSTQSEGCREFHELSKSDGATRVKAILGCSLCLDWMGKHKAQECKATSKSGKPYEA